MEPCELCLVKQQLKMYEGVVIDRETEKNVKLRDNDTQRDVYSWKPPYQEAILKSKKSIFLEQHMCLSDYKCMFSSIFRVVILSNIRNIDIEGKEDGKVLLQLLDAFRNECKVRFSFIKYYIGYKMKLCPSHTTIIMNKSFVISPNLCVHCVRVCLCTMV